MPKSKTQRLRVRLAKDNVKSFEALLKNPEQLASYDLRRRLGFSGRLFVAPPAQGAPPWLEFVQTGIDERITNLTNRSNAAVLIVKTGRRFFAYTFGHGRYLLKDELVESTFGLKTALNALKPDSLRSLDSTVFEGQAVHRRTQASRASGIEVFGIDIDTDILRAVTGAPREDLPIQSISGCGPTVAVSIRNDFEELDELPELLLKLFRQKVYKENFEWVDNVSSVLDPVTVNKLNAKLLKGLIDHSASLVPPEPIDWEKFNGFSYSRNKKVQKNDLSLEDYATTIPVGQDVTIERLHKDRVFMFAEENAEPDEQWPVYRCLLFDCTMANRKYLLTNGHWYVIEERFAKRIANTINQIPPSSWSLPKIRRINGTLEREAVYNARAAAKDKDLALLDKKLVKCEATSSRIEVCDLLSDRKHLIHVKHGKGGSSTLSHLLAQGRVSAEALLGDEQFRKEARSHLQDVANRWPGRIPIKRPVPSDYKVVFAILGYPTKPGSRLPFFTQVNLAKTYQDLTARGLHVELTGVPEE